jgi:hypothetical protein
MIKAIRTTISAVLSVLGLGVSAGSINFDDAPGGDLSLDDIFGDSQGSPTTVNQTSSEPQSTPVDTNLPAEPVIKTKTGTVYKSIEDAVSGIEHKDALIASLREQVRVNTGQDPLSQRRPDPVQSGPKSYLEDQGQYFEDIADAVSKKDTAAYMKAQQKLIWDNLGPLAPTITALSKANAERVVSSEIPEFAGFLNSEQYQTITQHSPLLADAIRTAESNPAAGSQLTELYRVAYLASQGSRVPELVRSARQEPSQVQSRPTVHSTPVPPPAVTGIPVIAPSLETREGRKALIEQAEARGIGNLKW